MGGKPLRRICDGPDRPCKRPLPCNSPAGSARRGGSGHPLAACRSILLARVAEEPFILREKGSGTRLATERHFAEHGLKLKVRMKLGSNEAIKQAIAGGLGVSVVNCFFQVDLSLGTSVHR
ncbi:MAG: LysR substrate-binding domain-containing protein [Rhodocyclaceae bacterium]|nr:LysR substrate-binding domain-containing protein [Rhodocyclaceae bacterium]